MNNVIKRLDETCCKIQKGNPPMNNESDYLQKPKLPAGKLVSEFGPDSFMKYLIPIVVFSSILASTIFFLYKDNAQSLNKKQQAYDSGKRAAEINLEPNCNPYIMLDAKQSKEWLDGYMSVKTNPEKRTP